MTLRPIGHEAANMRKLAQALNAEARGLSDDDLLRLVRVADLEAQGHGRPGTRNRLTARDVAIAARLATLAAQRDAADAPTPAT